MPLAKRPKMIYSGFGNTLSGLNEMTRRDNSLLDGRAETLARGARSPLVAGSSSALLRLLLP